MGHEINTVGVVGLGTMGAGIVEVFARNGIEVVAVEIDDARAGARPQATLTGSTERAVARGKLTAEDRDALLGRITFAVGLDGARPTSTWRSRRCPSTSSSSRRSSRELDRVCKPDAILATNTSVAVGHRDLGRHPPAQPRGRACTSSTRPRSCGWSRWSGRWSPRRRGGRGRRGALRPAGQGRRDHQRPGRLHRQRAAVRLPQPRGVHVRGQLRHPRGHRRGDAAGLRAADGPARADGPDRARHRVRDPRHDVPPGWPGPPARAGAAAQADGHGRAARPQERQGLLHLRGARVRRSSSPTRRRRRAAEAGAAAARAGGQGRRGRLRHHGRRHRRGLRQGRVRRRLGDAGAGEVGEARARRSTTSLDKAVVRGKLAEADRDAALGRITWSDRARRPRRRRPGDRGRGRGAERQEGALRLARRDLQAGRRAGHHHLEPAGDRVRDGRPAGRPTWSGCTSSTRPRS